MLTRNYSKLIFGILLLSYVTFATSKTAPPSIEQSEIRIVTHTDIQQSSIDNSTLRAIFFMHLQEWPNGEPVKVFVLRDRNKTHQAFSKGLLGFFPYQLRRNWDKLVFSGTGEAPEEVKSIDKMKSAVAGTPGSIGYIPLNFIDENLKVLEVK